jgi:hypothetical protein
MYFLISLVSVASKSPSTKPSVKIFMVLSVLEFDSVPFLDKQILFVESATVDLKGTNISAIRSFVQAGEIELVGNFLCGHGTAFLLQYLDDGFV